MKPANFDKHALNSLLTDSKVLDQVRDALGKDHHRAMIDELKLNRPHVLAIVEPPERGRERAPGELTNEEAIVLSIGRPPLLVKNGTWELSDVPELNNRLNAAKSELENAIRSVARLEVTNHESLTYMGTAWMIAEDVMITNRHVAEEFAYRQGNTIRFLASPMGQTYRPQVDFLEEYGSDEVFEIPIHEVLYMEPRAPSFPDLALVRVDPHPKLPLPIDLDPTTPNFHDYIAAIGYPAADASRNDRLMMEKLFKSIYEVKRLSPGWITGVDMQLGLLTHDCSTLGGSSGSVLIALSTGKAVGLHFSGEYRTGNYAIPSAVIRDRLRILNSSGGFISPKPVQATGGFQEERPQPSVEELEDRIGYDPDFLGKCVDLPEMTTTAKNQHVVVKNSVNGLLNYLHFSIAMNKSRRMAFYTACNIDGNCEFPLKRTGKDPWVLDPRIDESLQIGHELYTGTNLQRGHLVRRLDPCWGPSKKVATQAELDTFFFSNCTPQHENFNPKSWLSLEEYVLQNAWKEDMKVTVFTGPIFRDTDKTFRGVQIPEEYWKVIIAVREENGELSATGYIVSQADWMNELEFVYGEFKTYQVPIKTIEELTGILFPNLHSFDPLSNIESRTVRLIKTPQDIRI